MVVEAVVVVVKLLPVLGHFCRFAIALGVEVPGSPSTRLIEIETM